MKYDFTTLVPGFAYNPKASNFSFKAIVHSLLTTVGIELDSRLNMNIKQKLFSGDGQRQKNNYGSLCAYDWSKLLQWTLSLWKVFIFNNMLAAKFTMAIRETT